MNEEKIARRIVPEENDLSGGKSGRPHAEGDGIAILGAERTEKAGFGKQLGCRQLGTPHSFLRMHALADNDRSRAPVAKPELDDPDVSANSVVMAALGGGHPEKHKVVPVVTGWPGQARP